MSTDNLTVTLKDEVIDRFERGEDVAEIAEALDLWPSRVREILDEHDEGRDQALKPEDFR